MNTPATSNELVIRRTFAASPELLFDAWTTPEHMKNWFGPADTYTNPFIEIDLCVGGKYRICFESDKGKRSIVSGEYQVVDRPGKLAFTWKWEPPQEYSEHDTLVTVEFMASDKGAELVLTHQRFTVEQMLNEHNQGWTGCLARLEKLFSTT